MQHNTFERMFRLQEIAKDCFQAEPRSDRSQQMFGGQFIAQAMQAASRTVPQDRNIHSLHAYFLRPGNPSDEMVFRVSRVRDGRSFSHRHVVAVQQQKEMFLMIASFAVPLISHEFTGKHKVDVPPPDEISYTYEQFCRDQIPDPDYIRDVSARPMDIRYINPPTDRAKVSRVEDQLMWVRVTAPIEGTQSDHQAALGFLSDSTLIDHILIPHGKRWQDPDFEGTSLDHAMWFHGPVNANEWLLFDQTVEWTGDGRGLATGRMYTESGTLVATCAQEGLMRFESK